MSRLAGRVAIVTGSGRGIGAAVAQAFAAEGAAVVVADLGVELDGTTEGSDPATEVVEAITAAGGTAVASRTDVSDHGQAEELIATAIERFGTLDVLVNAAGILRDRMIFNMEEEEWDAVIRVHLKGAFNTTKFAARHWRETRRPNCRLINFTSVAGLQGAPSQPNYAAAKMGIVGLTLSCANALSKYGVTANCISPGAATRMTDTIPAEVMAKYLAAARDSDPDGRRRAPENVAAPLVYLASTESGWINGRVLGAQEYRVSMWSTPQIQRQIVGQQPWELDHLFDEMARAFKPYVEGRGRLDEAG